MTDATQIPDFGFRPLYRQVKEHLVRRLIDGVWRPGQLIPSEIELARELKVSQGTVRKALDALTAENLLVRRQGRGTYVAEPEESRILFQFFHLIPDSNERTSPTSRVLRWTRACADEEEAAALSLTKGDQVWRIKRIRFLDDAPLIVETIVLADERFPSFEALSKIPNNIYRLYSQRWGITIAAATEKLKAIAATAKDAAVLDCPPATPLLEIKRVAFDLENSAVEFRVSRCLTHRAHYLSLL